jgi:hypothetical protein
MAYKWVIVALLFVLFISFLFGLSKNEYNKIYDEIVASKEWVRGITAFKQAVKEYPEELGFHLILNYFLRENKQFEEALRQGR